MSLKNLSIAILLLTAVTACRKMADEKQPVPGEKTGWRAVTYPEGFFKSYTVPGVATNSINQPVQSHRLSSDSTPDPNNGDDSIVLGQHLNNPYTVSNMQQAYYQLYGSTDSLSPNYLYVRFKPADIPQLQTLLSDDNLELQDYPMDYEVLQDGDYYQDPTLGTEDIGWLYTAVPVGYTPPSGIQYQVIEQLYIPNNDLAVENMAESLAAGGSYRTTTNGNTRTIVRTDVPNGKTVITPDLLPTPCEIDPCAAGCPFTGDNCGGSGGNPTDPSSNNNDPRLPRGQLQVQDIITCTSGITNVPVRQARIVCKRWFKIARTFTTDLGNFVVSKKFNNKVKILYKTKNDFARVSKIRGIRLWQILFPVKKRIGVFDRGDMNHVTHIVTKPNPTNAHDKELPYWVAATTHNTIIEYRQYATEMGVALPPMNLHLMVSNWGGAFRAIGATPMWNKCGPLPQELNDIGDYIRFFAAGLNQALAISLIGVLKNETDVLITYTAPNGDYDCRLTSRDLKELTFHELGHVSHFVQAGCGYWQDYRTRISNEIAFGNPATRPYGDGTETNAGVVGLGEMWGNHCGYIFTDRHYGNGGGATDFVARIQGRAYNNASGPSNAYINAIESFDPTQTTDVQHWIPMGLCYDLIDPVGETTPVIDNVSGYTTGQCFNALQSDVRTVPAFRDRLLQQNTNNQSLNVNNLFFRYGY